MLTTALKFRTDCVSTDVCQGRSQLETGLWNRTRAPVGLHNSTPLAPGTMTRISMFAENGVNIERHAYCLCLHVRPATIFVALINLVSDAGLLTPMLHIT